MSGVPRLRARTIRLVAALLFLVTCAACGDRAAMLGAGRAAPPGADRPAPRVAVEHRRRGLRVRGNRLLDRAGEVVHLHGVNRSGTEYACVQGWGIFDGPHSAASVAAIARWRVNIV